MFDVELANPKLLWLLLILIPITAWYVWKTFGNNPTLKISTGLSFANSRNSIKAYLRHIMFVFNLLVIFFLVVILARPQKISVTDNTTEGIDIVMAIDVSSSMLAKDFDPNRLEAAKAVAIEFISGHPSDRIGLVVFSGESFTQCPLTSDHAALINLLLTLEVGMVEDGTAVGLGLANALSRLKDSKSKSKVVILLTDGVNNVGNIAPLTAADIAVTLGVRVYTIGIGKNGYAPYPVQTLLGVQYMQQEVQIDESTLIKIAEKTEGKYFRATDQQTLIDIYKEIDKLEKMEIESDIITNYDDKYLPFALLAALLLIINVLLKNTVFQTIP